MDRLFCWCLFVFNNNIKTNTNTQKCYKLKTKTTDQPPIGFIYASTAPPPYPGLPPSGQQVPQYPPPGGPPQQQHPPPAYNELGYPSANTYPGQQPAGPYPTPMAAPGPYPTSATGPTPTPANSNPIQHAHNANYPNQPASVPAGRQPSMGYPLPEQQAPSNQPQNPLQVALADIRRCREIMHPIKHRHHPPGQQHHRTTRNGMTKNKLNALKNKLTNIYKLFVVVSTEEKVRKKYCYCAIVL